MLPLSLRGANKVTVACVQTSLTSLACCMKYEIGDVCTQAQVRSENLRSKAGGLSFS